MPEPEWEKDCNCADCQYQKAFYKEKNRKEHDARPERLPGDDRPSQG